MGKKSLCKFAFELIKFSPCLTEASDGEDDDGPAVQPEGNRMVGITADQLASALLQAQQVQF